MNATARHNLFGKSNIVSNYELNGWNRKPFRRQEPLRSDLYGSIQIKPAHYAWIRASRFFGVKISRRQVGMATAAGLIAAMMYSTVAAFDAHHQTGFAALAMLIMLWTTGISIYLTALAK